MKSERLQKIDQVFQSALDLAPQRRPRFLDEACAADPDLRREVESLLDAHEQAGDFIEDSAADVATEFLAEKQMLVPAGGMVGHYRVEVLLGAGGMGEVYLATDKWGRKVALKLLTRRRSRDESIVVRFQQEAQTLLALNHPNIVTIYDIGQTETVHYIASELVEGETLRQRLEKSDIDLREVLEVAIQIATALAAAHEKGIVHRDIKPENVMIRRDGYVKVLDFGIAKLTEEYATDSEAPTRRQVETAEGTVVGTAPYMSPEQVRDLTVDGRTDLWSLGVALYETVTGRKPFFGDTTQDVLAAVLQKEPPPLSRYVHEVPEELEWIVSKALRKERGARYQTATELLIDLKELKKKIELATSLASEPTGGALQSTRGRTTEVAASAQSSSAEYIVTEIKRHKLAVIISLLVLAAAIVGLGVFLLRNTEVAIDSIAVLPFVNQSQNPDTEYLSDGLSESIINSLTELKDLRVIPRSSSFRYKGKESDPLSAGHDLGVRAVLTGRVTQRGDSLIVSAELVDVRDNKEVWGQQYNRKLADLLPLQTELARDVSQKLRARLSGTDEHKLTKTYTANAEAYQLYLKGRYHVLKLTLSEIQTGISYFQQAIAIDPSYALAYVGLADAYRSALAGDMPPTELLPKAKEAAQKAIEIDDTLADAHAELGFIIFWYDWDWTAAENQYKRALELDPNGADTHLFYAHLLSNTGRHAEALAEVKRARELDPLNLRTNTLEGQFLIHAGRTDEAIARLQKTFEMAPNYYFAHLFAASAYIEKGMFPEAIAEAQKARELSGPTNSHPMGFLGYALAKSGKQAEARALLEELLKRSTERYVSPYNIALIYNGLGERDNTFAWLERGYEKRDQRMIFLEVEPKWNNLRGDPRFQDLLRRVGLSR